MKYLQIGLKTMKIIEFDLNLYDQKCIEKSIEDFSDIAEIILENLTVCEFSNYIIDLMNVI